MGRSNFLGKSKCTEDEIRQLYRNLEEGEVGGMNYMFPRAWEHPGLLHIFYNALQSSLLRLPEWESIERALRGFSRF